MAAASASGRSVSAMSETAGQSTQTGMGPGGNDPRYVICVDYGTTFTGVGWILTEGRTPSLADIQIIQHWGGNIEAKVPSVFTYSANSGQKWGYDIGNSAYVIRWTKLRLEVPKRLNALQSMKHMAEEARMLNLEPQGRRAEIPRHLVKTSVDIVTDYLREVINHVRGEIENTRDARELQQFPIDIVITHPAVWDDRAKNLTFRAVMSAFRSVFQDIQVKPGYIRLATESEACAQYTLQAARAEGMVGAQQLRVGECFIVVDAGGGTVDLVSYRIDQMTPEFKITKITPVSGGRFGATRIDNCFLHEFLEARLGPANYNRLLSMEGASERHGGANHNVLKLGEQLMLERFEIIKREFEGRTPDGRAGKDMVLDLPPSIGRNNTDDDQRRGIRGGQLTVTCEDMEMMFQECVDGIKGLIEKQLVLIDQKQLVVRTIFLSGGFSKNKYLFKCIQDLARSRRFELLGGGDDCWTAVAKGGVLLGLGLGCKVPRAVVPCPYNFGVVISKTFALYDHRPDQRYRDSLDHVERAHEHVEWVVSKGDLIKYDEPTEKTVKLVRKLTQVGSRAGRVTLIVSAADEPERFSPSDTSRREVGIDFDLANLPPDIYRQVARTVTNPRTKKTYETLQMQLEISLSQDRADIALVCGNTVDMMGRISNRGFLLRSAEPILFPGIAR
ncbi:hypothetical protein NEMBOFW57_009284 [Staphylotrichum longicolle]|uniref:Uncharacterized protein n=1 Tax=Staphylotrichum longicolle TaxID=669026 RepID=A0AAD4EP86_9PEZI|nr:hypothetical protein NEMBOFW57_009284 [Staphylotrichum longicolle]